MFEQQMKHLLESVGPSVSGLSLQSAGPWLPVIFLAFVIGLGVRVYLYLGLRRGRKFVSEFKQRVESGAGAKDTPAGFAAVLEQVLDGTLRATFPSTASTGAKIKALRTQAALNRLIDGTLKRASTIETCSASELREHVAEVFNSNNELGPRASLEFIAEALPRFFLVTGVFASLAIALGGVGAFHPGMLKSMSELHVALDGLEQSLVHCVGLAVFVAVLSMMMAVLTTFLSMRNGSSQLTRDFASALGLLRARFAQSGKASFQTFPASPAVSAKPSPLPPAPPPPSPAAVREIVNKPPVTVAQVAPVSTPAPVAAVKAVAPVAPKPEETHAEVDPEVLWKAKPAPKVEEKTVSWKAEDEVPSRGVNLEEEMTRKTEESTSMNFDWEPESEKPLSENATQATSFGLPTDLWQPEAVPTESQSSGRPMDESAELEIDEGFVTQEDFVPVDEDESGDGDGKQAAVPAPITNAAPAVGEAVSAPSIRSQEFEFPPLFDEEPKANLAEEKIAALLRTQTELDRAIESAYQDRLNSKISEEMFQEKHKIWKATRDANEQEIESLRAGSSTKAAA